MIILIIILIVLIFIFTNTKSTFGSTQKVHVVSFAHNCCAEAQKNLEETAMMYGATNVYSLTLDTLDAPKYVKYQITRKKMQTHIRGRGNAEASEGCQG